jgi:DAK2 domain fusion protein YloV
VDGPIEAIDVRTLHEALRRFTTALEEHRDELDSLNVFPVPDGDTGTNLLLTMREVTDELERLDDPSPRAFSAAVASASLMAARGNSGVILAQVLRALAGRLLGSAGDGGSMATALETASAEARRAVARPVEGTVLTVLRDAATAASQASEAGGALEDVTSAALHAGKESLARTTESLPELADAGVVDAGGLGGLLLLDALASVATGAGMTVAVGSSGPVGEGGLDEQDVAFKFEVMFLVRADDGAVPDLREHLGELGDSLVVVGSDGLYKVHVHTDERDAPVQAASEVGTVEDVRVVDLEDQVAEHCVAGQARGVRVGERMASALVAVADGGGIARLFRSLGAVVVPGPSPSLEDLVLAIEGAAAGSVVVLPNGSETVPVAERAAGESGKDVWVVAAQTVPEGLAAATAFNQTAAAVDAAEQMTEAVAAVTTAVLVRTDGEWTGGADGEVNASGPDAVTVAVEVLELLRTADHEVLTVLAGAGIPDEDFDDLVAALALSVDDLEIEVHRGDQPGEGYLLGLE